MPAGRGVRENGESLSYSYEQLLAYYQQLSGKLDDLGHVEGLSSFGVDQRRGVLSVIVHPHHDREKLARLLQGLPPSALSVELAEGGWFAYIPENHTRMVGTDVEDEDHPERRLE